MPGYEYNPLTKLDLQKKSGVTPADIQHIEEEISSINEDLKNKVPKFFLSIEEIEVGEIGQYQGDSNSTFKNGDFYKRGQGGYKANYTQIDNLTLLKREPYSEKIFQTATSGICPYDEIEKDQYNGVVASSDGTVILCFPLSSGVHTNCYVEDLEIDSGRIVWTGYLLALRGDSWSDSEIIPIKVEEGAIYVYYNNVWNLIVDRFSYAWGMSNRKYNAYILQEGHIVNCCFFKFVSNYIVIPGDESNPQCVDLALFRNNIEINLQYWDNVHDDQPLYSINFAFDPLITHVGFATLQQGEKADNALQEVHGTNGLYISTTVSGKNANKEQTISTSLTLQNVETADETHKGVAEAANVRAYFNIIAATSEAYGVMWDTANPSPNCIRIGNMRNHALLPVQSQIVGGVMADDGTFTPFDNQADWTQATQARDGSDGQVMVRIHRHWRRCSQFGTYNIVMLSPVEIPGYVEVREQYVSAYEATLQHSTSKLSSVNNATTDYRGGQNEASWDGTYRSLLNRPITNLNLAEFRTYARNRGNGTKWNCMTYEAVRTIFWLFVTEYATLNSQDEYTSELDVNGFHQGGLGIGVSDLENNAWNNYNGYAPLIPCGVLDEYGSGTAVKNFSIYNANTTLAHIFQCNKYRGIEMPFAHIWKYVDGVLINVASGNGVSTAYTTIEPADFSSTSVANYNAICNTYRVDSYIKGIVFNPDGDIFATQDGANSTSYYCDQYLGANIPSTTELRAWRFGGSASDGALCGLACARSNSVPGYRSRFIGSRLCFVP